MNAIQIFVGPDKELSARNSNRGSGVVVVALAHLRGVENGTVFGIYHNYLAVVVHCIDFSGCSRGRSSPLVLAWHNRRPLHLAAVWLDAR